MRKIYTFAAVMKYKKRKILLLDNRDSFTYNIVDYLRRMEGVDWEVADSSSFDLERLDDYDKIIFSPGPGLPPDFPVLFEVLRRCYRRKPILGICLGHQAIAQFFGARLYNISPVVHGQGHLTKILGRNSLFTDIPDYFTAGLYHSWAVSREGFPDALEITAVAGNNVIMGIASKRYPVYGLQFHPESFITEYGFQILQNFIHIDL